MVDPERSLSGRFSLADRLRSFRFAFAGLRYLLASEHNARLHLVATLAVILLGALIGISVEEWRWVLLAAALVWISEAFNTALERLGDEVSLENGPNIGHAKDVAATAVMLASLTAAIIGVSVFTPYLVLWLGR